MDELATASAHGDPAFPGAIHHVELWVPSLTRAAHSWSWLLGRLGYQPNQQWQHGRSWRLGPSYIVLEQSPALRPDRAADRLGPGLNHLAFHAPSRQAVDQIAAAAPAQGWTLLFADRHPFAGGPQHYAAYLEDHDGFEVELAAPPDGGTDLTLPA